MQFSLRQGLQQSQVMSIAEDAEGTLYVGLQGGSVNRFDGRQFSILPTADGQRDRFFARLGFHAPMNTMLALAQSGSLYAIQNDSLHLYPHQFPYPENTFRGFQMCSTPEAFYGMSYRGGLYELNETGWQGIAQIDIAEGAYISYLGEHEGRLLAASSQGRVYRLQDKQWKEIFLSTGKPVYDILDYKKGYLLATDQGVYFWKAGQIRSLTDLPARRLALWEEDQLFIAGQQGVYYAELDDKAQLLQKERVLSLQSYAIYQDDQQVIWLGTMGGGLYRASNNFSFFGSEQGLAQSVVMAVAPDAQGRSWLGFQNQGVQVLEDGNISRQLNLRPYHPDKAIGSNAVGYLLAKDANHMWAATPAGLASISNDLKTVAWFQPDSIIGFSPTCLAYDADSTLWIGHRDGVLKVDRSGKQTPVSLHDSIAYYGVWTLDYDAESKEMLVGTDKGTYLITSDHQLHYLGEEMALDAVKADDFWIVGSEFGVYIYNAQYQKLSQLTQQQGLLSDFIYAVTADAAGNIWLGTAHGLACLSLNAEGQVKKLTTYTEQHGFFALESNHGANYFDGEHLWLGTVDGLYKFQPERMPMPQLKPRFTAIRSHYDRQDIDAFADTTQGYLAVLPPEHNHLTFHFGNNDRYFTDQIAFQHQLDGLEEEFSLPSDQAQVAYANIPPGAYTFRLRASLPDGRFREISYPFFVKAPFYQTPLFWALAGLMVLLLIFMLIRYRTGRKLAEAQARQQLREQTLNRIRAEIARDFHDEMGNKLVRIINYSSMLRLHQNGNRLEILDKVEGAAKQLYHGTRDFIWSLNPENDSLAELVAYLSDFGNKLFEEKQIRFYTQFPAELNISLPAGYSRDLVLILKEGMTNIFKHAGASQVWLQLEVEKGSMRWSLFDDGSGLPENVSLSSRGLRNMQVRARRLGGDITLRNKVPQGTEIILTIPLARHETN